MKVEMAKFIGVVQKHSPKHFINHNNELIVVPSWNIYFELNRIQTVLDLKCSVLNSLSRPSCKGVSNYWQKRVRAIVNEYLGTDFNRDEMERIYAYLGNGIRKPLTVQFVESGYDLSILPELTKCT